MGETTYRPKRRVVVPSCIPLSQNGYLISRRFQLPSMSGAVTFVILSPNIPLSDNGDNETLCEKPPAVVGTKATRSRV